MKDDPQLLFNFLCVSVCVLLPGSASETSSRPMASSDSVFVCLLMRAEMEISKTCCMNTEQFYSLSNVRLSLCFKCINQYVNVEHLCFISSRVSYQVHYRLVSSFIITLKVWFSVRWSVEFYSNDYVQLSEEALRWVKTMMAWILIQEMSVQRSSALLPQASFETCVVVSWIQTNNLIE